MAPTSAHEPAHEPDMTRRVNTVTRDGEPTRVLVARRTLAAPAPEVWAALTTAERVSSWFLPVSGELREGGRFQLEGHAGGQVLTCVAPERLSLTWESDDGTSWVDVSLRPTSEGTLLQLDHTAPLTPQRWDEYGPGAVGIGWELLLGSLADHLDHGDEDVRPPADPADLTRAAAEGWAEAAIADGDDPDGARAAAARCVAAYVGE